MIQLMEAAAESAETVESALQLENVHWDQLIDKLIDLCVTGGKNIIAAILVYVIGSFLIKLIQKLLSRMLERRNVDKSVQSFLKSTVRIVLVTLLIISVVGALGVNTTSFAALLASAGVAVGMALSGNLQNFAGGLIILFFKPYKLGDWVEAQGVEGEITGIQIMHTLITTLDSKLVYVPNGTMSSGVIINYSKMPLRMENWIISIEYGQDVDKVKAIAEEILCSEPRILPKPGHFIALHALEQKSVNVTIRGWVKNEDYWNVGFDINKKIYDAFNKEGIKFAYEQIKINQQK